MPINTSFTSKLIQGIHRKLKDEETDRQSDARMCTDRRMNPWMDGWIDEWMDRQMDKQMNGPTDGWM